MSEDTSADAILSDWCLRFADALHHQDIARITALFEPECFWRDLLAFTWNIKTLEGRSDIAAMLSATLEGVRPSEWSVAGKAQMANDLVQGFLTFETALARGNAYVRLRAGLCWTLLTSVYELKNFEEPRGRRRPFGDEHCASRPPRRNWQDRRHDAARELGKVAQPYVVIVGGGQGGLGLGARLKMLNVPTLIIDRHARSGDQWRSRYKSLSLHDPVWYDHMPYVPFPEHWPVFTPKDKMGDWLEMYASIMELDIWTSTECLRASFDEDSGKWTVELNRDGHVIVLHPEHLVLATGNAGMPRMPDIPGAADFLGRQYHSSRHPGGSGFAGKRVVVLGANNSAHDICADLWEHGASVTMIQRSSTLIARSTTLIEMTMSTLYSEDAVARGLTTEMADLIFASIPLRVLPDIQRPLFAQILQRDAEFYRRLAEVGFLLDFGDDESGLYMKYLRRGSGYYIDVGASQLLIDGCIHLRSGESIDHLEPHEVVLSNGERLQADAVIYATGFGSMEEFAATLISPRVAQVIGRCWGYGSGTSRDPGPWAGELHNMWKPTRQRGLWFHGGNLHQSRHYSLYLALQLKARMERLPMEVYGAPVAIDAAGGVHSNRP